jgi:uncharacterized protein (TIGR02757 family)
MQGLQNFLEKVQQDYHQKKYLTSDPLEFVHHFQDPWDQEAVALLSALLAYGQVAQIRSALKLALHRIQQTSTSPREFVQRLENSAFKKRAMRSFDGYVHRFNTGIDLVQLLCLLGKSWAKYGSLGGHFLSHLKATDLHIGPALDQLIKNWKGSLGGQASPTVFYLLTAPASGSCCKRWCLFLRWMGRKDHLDPGLWRQTSLLSSTFPKSMELSPSQLIMPLDTHTGRLSQYLGLTSRKSLNWKAALEVTEAMKKMDPEDPTRYDFALSRLGILDICQRSYREEICKKCQLLPVCQFAQKSYKLASRFTQSSASSRWQP